MEKKPIQEKLREFQTGATRSTEPDGERHDLISPYVIKRLARIYAEGAEIHGDRNWEKGVPLTVTMNHLKAHLNKWESGDRTEDHLAKAAWGLFAIMHYEDTGYYKRSNTMPSHYGSHSTTKRKPGKPTPPRKPRRSSTQTKRTTRRGARR